MRRFRFSYHLVAMRYSERAKIEIGRIVDSREPFTGTVIRRDEREYRKPSVHLTWRCGNRFCREWTMNKSYVTGRCNFCFTPRFAGGVIQ